MMGMTGETTIVAVEKVKEQTIAIQEDTIIPIMITQDLSTAKTTDTAPTAKTDHKFKTRGNKETEKLQRTKFKTNLTKSLKKNIKTTILTID